MCNQVQTAQFNTICTGFLNMMLLDLLLEIERIETTPGRESFAEGLYKTNKKFAQLCDLTYVRSNKSLYGDGNDFPAYKQDKVPYGMNYSQLEIIHNKLKAVAFTERGKTPVLAPVSAEKKMIQIFESLSDIECQFVKYVLRKDIPWFPRTAWIRSKFS